MKITQTETTPFTYRENVIDGELTDLRRLSDAMQKVIEDYVGADLEAYEPLMGLVSAIRDKVDAMEKMLDAPLPGTAGADASELD